MFENLWGGPILAEPGLRIPNMFDSAIGGSFKGLFVHGEDIAQSDPNLQHVRAALTSMEMVVVQDLFLNETARYAHVFVRRYPWVQRPRTRTPLPLGPLRCGRGQRRRMMIAPRTDVSTTSPSS